MDIRLIAAQAAALRLSVDRYMERHGAHAFATVARDGALVAVGPDMSRPGQGRYRVTTFRGGEPSGHVEFVTFRDACIFAVVDLGATIPEPTTATTGVSPSEACPTINATTGQPCKGKRAAAALAQIVLAHHDDALPGVCLPRWFQETAEAALRPFGWPDSDALRAKLGI